MLKLTHSFECNSGHLQLTKLAMLSPFLYSVKTYKVTDFLKGPKHHNSVSYNNFYIIVPSV